MSRTAAVTMQYNEDFFLPRWIEYYGSQLGRDNLYVIDNDSDSAVRAHLVGISTVRYARTAFDDQQRARFVSKFASSLLELYDTVIFTDCDEFIAPDPSTRTSLRAWLDANDFDRATCIGLNVLALIDEENAILGEGNILSQRRHVRFVSPMCKTAIIRKPIRWGGGFHHSNQPPQLRDIYLFHLKYADVGERLRRQATTRAMAWAHPEQGMHQRFPDVDLLNQFLSFTRLPKQDWSAEVLDVLIAEFCNRIVKSPRGGDIGTMYVAPLDVVSDGVMRLPAEFATLF